jgi:hypothetical protein
LTRYASVYPLVTARALAREFTYEVPDEVAPGAVVEVRVFEPGRNVIGAYTSYQTTTRGARRRDLCLYPSAAPGGAAPKRPARCPRR